MKLTAHSLVPSSPMQYMHLGYISAAPQKNASGPLFWAVLFFAIALLTFKKSQLLALVLVIATAVTCYWAGMRYQQGVTMLVIGETRHMQILVDTAATDGPASAHLASKAGVTGSRMRWDNWGTPFRFEEQKQGTRLQYYLMSAGPDRRFGTYDDIHVTSWVAQSTQKAGARQRSSGK